MSVVVILSLNRWQHHASLWDLRHGTVYDFRCGIFIIFFILLGQKVARVANARKDTCNREVFRHQELKDIVKIKRVRNHFICKQVLLVILGAIHLLLHNNTKLHIFILIFRLGRINRSLSSRYFSNRGCESITGQM